MAEAPRQAPLGSLKAPIRRLSSEIDQDDVRVLPHSVEHGLLAVDGYIKDCVEAALFNRVSRSFTTPAMMELEQDTIDHMRAGQGYKVEGFAPTSRAAHTRAESGIESNTLQHHLAREEKQSSASGQKRLYVLDESSLVSTKQMHTFLERLGPEDRLLLVGDVRLHAAVDAGRAYHQSTPNVLSRRQWGKGRDLSRGPVARRPP